MCTIITLIFNRRQKIIKKEEQKKKKKEKEGRNIYKERKKKKKERWRKEKRERRKKEKEKRRRTRTRRRVDLQIPETLNADRKLCYQRLLYLRMCLSFRVKTNKKKKREVGSGPGALL